MRGVRGFALLAVGWLVGCRSEAPPVETHAIEVTFGGCAEVWQGPVCAVGGEPLRLWVPAAVTAARVGERAVEVEAVEAAGGYRVELAVGAVEAGAQLAVEAGAGRWSLALAPAPAPVSLAGDDAAARVAAGRAKAAAAGASAAGARARWARAAGRLAMRRGAFDEAVGDFEAAAVDAAAAGLVSEQRLALITAAHARFVQGRLGEARAVLARLPALAEGDGAGRYATAYVTAVVARAGGDLRSAVRALGEAAAAAGRVGTTGEARAARNELGLVLLELGRADEAVEVLAAVRAGLGADAGGCVRGDAASNLGWARLRAGRPPGALFDEAVAAYAGCDEARAQRVALARINAAVAALEADDPAAAGAALAAIEAGADDILGAEVAAWRWVVRGRVARRAGDRAAAAEAAAALAARAEASGSAALGWRASVEAGLTAEAGCDWAGAAGHYAAAEGRLFDESLQVAAGGGRGRFLADRGESAALLVRARMAMGDADGALAAARRARRRALLGFAQQARLAGLSPARRARWEALYAAYGDKRAALDAEAAADWDRSAEDLAALAPGRATRRAELSALLDEMATLAGGALRADAPLRPLDGLTVAWFEQPARRSACAGAAPGAGWVFVARGAGVEAAAVVRWDAPFAPVEAAVVAGVEAGGAVTLMPAAALRGRDLHLEAVGGQALGLRAPVVFRLDLPAAGVARGEKTALVVVDPRVDLSAARREGAAVAARLEAGGWSVQTRVGDAASRAALRAGLAEAALFHYAGHAEAAGLDGWESALLLADGAMTVGDLLTLPRAPRWAVLAGCETGEAHDGLGLAHALLSTGAEAVVATVRPVEDADAAAFSAGFYAAFEGDVAGAYRAGLGALRAEARGAFRLWVP